MAEARITSLFENDVLHRLERLRIQSRRHFTNRSQGQYLHGRGGSSTEFSDYRDYSDGDDIRHIDWNIFARLQRPYMKIFKQEEDMHVVLLVDASASMAFEDKLLRARQFAAAFGIMGMMNMERVSCWSFPGAGDAPARLAPATGRQSIGALLRFIEDIEGGGEVILSEAVESVLKIHRGRGLVFLLSDFMSPGDLEKTFNRLYGKGLEVCAVQLLGPSEWTPDLSRDMRLEDSETGRLLDVTTTGDLETWYREHLRQYQFSLEAGCRKRGGRFLALNSGADFESLYFGELRRKGWVV